MFDNLTEKLDRAFKLLKGQGTITEVFILSISTIAKESPYFGSGNYKLS